MKQTFKQFLLEVTDDLDGDFDTFQTKNAKAKRWPEEMWKHIKGTLKTDPEHKFMGAGSNAYVSKKDNPHHMDYVQRTSSVYDGGALYQMAVLKNKEIQKNPYAPKILSVDNTNKKYPTINLEPLVAYKALKDNEQVLKHYIDKIFIDPTVNQYQISLLPVEKQLMFQLVGLLRIAMRRGGENIKDQQMLQLVNFIYDVQDNVPGKLFVDIHTDNVMWRLSNQGPQLVIIDPLAET